MSKKEEYSVKEELKEEGKFFGKSLLVGTINSLGKLGRGAIGVFRDHPKVEELKEDVEEHIEEIEEGEAESG